MPNGGESGHSTPLLEDRRQDLDRHAETRCYALVLHRLFSPSHGATAVSKSLAAYQVFEKSAGNICSKPTNFGHELTESSTAFILFSQSPITYRLTSHVCLGHVCKVETIDDHRSGKTIFWLTTGATRWTSFCTVNFLSVGAFYFNLECFPSRLLIPSR